MKDLLLKITSIIMTIATLGLFYIYIQPETNLEIAGTVAMLALPFKFITKESYKFWKEI